MWIQKPIEGLIENNLAPVIWIEGIGAISMADGAVCTHYYARRETFSGRAEKTVELILKRSTEGLIRDICMSAGAIRPLFDTKQTEPNIRPPKGWDPYVVK
jgi:hypothetical protein